jgi:putative AlgH/UPF0301 family transcriptional regulator
MNYLGKLLVAPPAQTDEFWGGSVIFIYEDNKSTIGLSLNKPSERELAELAEFHNIQYFGQEMINIGGSANPSALIMLHTDDWKCTNTMHVTDSFCISSDHTMLSRVCSGDHPLKWQLYLGMCIWPAGQLEKELLGELPFSKKKAWLTTTATEDILFERHPKKMWNKAINSVINYSVESFFTIN